MHAHGRVVREILHGERAPLPSALSAAAAATVGGLLTRAEAERLQTATDLRAQSFFAGTAWHKLLAKQLASPLLPSRRVDGKSGGKSGGKNGGKSGGKNGGGKGGDGDGDDGGALERLGSLDVFSYPSNMMHMASILPPADGRGGRGGGGGGGGGPALYPDDDALDGDDGGGDYGGGGGAEGGGGFADGLDLSDLSSSAPRCAGGGAAGAAGAAFAFGDATIADWDFMSPETRLGARLWQRVRRRVDMLARMQGMSRAGLLIYVLLTLAAHAATAGDGGGDAPNGQPQQSAPILLFE